MSGHRAKIISVFSPKGGCGKTVSTINIAGLLTKDFGKKVLVVDADTSANLTMGLAKSESSRVTMAELIKQVRRGYLTDSAFDAICETNFKNLDIIPCENKDEAIDAALMMSLEKSDPFHFFKTILLEVADDYDYIFLDVVGDAPELNSFALNALCASDYVLQPFKVDTFNFAAISDIREAVEKMNKLGNPNLKYLACFISGFNKKIEADRTLDEILKEQQGDAYIPCTIRQSTYMTKAITSQMPLCYYRKNLPEVEDYRALIKELLKKLEG